jgi:creatinine amidohydrolase/Fe(II)-dependent formamide hydrolase-like protein
VTEEPRVLRWETLSKKAFDEIDRERAVVLVTASPLEVHGPHLPIGADALEGEGPAERMLRLLEILGSFRSGLRFFQEETYSGPPGAASAELGERILDLLSGRAAEGCAELLDGRIGPDDCHSPTWPYASCSSTH